MESGAKKAGLKPIRVHDLRHSHVSLLISLGFSAVAIAKRMGHKSVNVTYRYAHLFPDAQTDMAGQLNDVMGPRASQDTEGDDEDV
jgi:integrase